MLSFIQMLIVGLYVMTSVLGLKTIGFFGTVVVSGVVFIAIFKPLLDIINEVWGEKEARNTVIKMSIVRALIFVGVSLIALLPAMKGTMPGIDKVLSGSVWLFLFGLLAEILASLVLDIPFFTWLKKHTKNGFLVRQYLSNLSLVVQSVVFTWLYVTFINTHVPFMNMFVGQIFALVAISSVLAPFAALIVRKIRK